MVLNLGSATTISKTKESGNGLTAPKRWDNLRDTGLMDTLTRTITKIVELSSKKKTERNTLMDSVTPKSLSSA
jgi:hypothetical protein